MTTDKTPETNIRMSGIGSAGSLKANNFKSFSDLMKQREVVETKKAPTYQWQELALKIIEDLDVPKEKRNSMFRVCKQYSRPIIERALSDTKELCKGGEKWRYFFKVIDIIKKKPNY